MNGIFLVRLAKTLSLGLRAFRALNIPIKINNPKINEMNNSISINKPIYLP